MSRKLVTIIKDSKIPGKWKRVLEAYAAFANNDGTNIYASQEKVAQKAGSSSRTIRRVTPDLSTVGVLKVAQQHTCKVKECNGGSSHYCGRNGKWTIAYNIDLAALKNAEAELAVKNETACKAKVRPARAHETYLTKEARVQIVPNQLGTDCPKPDGAICPKPQGANCPTDSGIKETPAPRAVELGKEHDSSAVPLEVSEEESFDQASSNLDDLETPGVLAERQNQERNPEEDAFTPEGILLRHIILKPSAASVRRYTPTCREILKRFEDAGKHACLAAILVLKFNRAHGDHKFATAEEKSLYIRRPDIFLKALDSENSALMTKYLEHDFTRCEICINAGADNYNTAIQRAEDRKRDEEERKQAEAEEQRLAKLCGRCKLVPFGKMYLPDGKDRIGHHVSVRVCDRCYDRSYEWQQKHIGDSSQKITTLLDRRPGYQPSKFDISPAAATEPSYKDWFKSNGKDGDWTWQFKDSTVPDLRQGHMLGVLRYLHARNEKVSKDQFEALLAECVLDNPIPAPLRDEL